jgi:hypothetical protein
MQTFDECNSTMSVGFYVSFIVLFNYGSLLKEPRFVNESKASDDAQQ